MGAGDEGTKEFDPSSQKLRRLRQQGNVPKSQDLSQLLSFIVAISCIMLCSGYTWNKLSLMFIALYGSIHLKSLDQIGAGFILNHTMAIFLMISIPMLLAVSFASIMGDVLQVGFMLNLDAISPKFDKFNPTKYFKNIFNVKTIVNFLKQIAKLFVLVIVAYQMVMKHLEKIIALSKTDSILIVGEVLKEIIVDFTINTTIALFIITVIDFAFQKFNYIKENRMTRKEMMDEYKQSEGDPQMKQKRKAMARQMMQGEQLEAVKEADFITTNPTKIAVAIKYSSGKMKAPLVLAKGSDSFAWRIIAEANKYKIPVIENIPLARALYKLAKVGAEIPPELYQAIAEILLFAYQISGKSNASKTK